MGAAVPPLPWTGSRARSRERGYAEAMHDLWLFADEMKNSRINETARRGCEDIEGLHAEVAVIVMLDKIASYARDAWLLGEVAAVTPEKFDAWIGQWRFKPAPVEV
jgi:hypothetical protein